MKNFDESYTATILGADGKAQEIEVSRNERARKPVEDRTFVIGGESFVYRTAVAPEAFKRWSAMVGGENVLRDDRGRPLLDENKRPISALTEEEALEIFDETVLAFLEPGQDEKWKSVRQPEAENPLNLNDIKALTSWLFEEQTSRPTGPSSGSSTGSATVETGTRSTDGSSSQAGTG